jgi:hypothetical protein
VAARLETLVGTPVQVPDLAGAPNGG